MLIDARIPVLFGALADAGETDVLLYEGEKIPGDRIGVSFVPGPGVLAAGCACCAPRGPLALSIGDMFLARAKGEIAFFRRVIAVPSSAEGRAAMLAVLTEDSVCAARFRVEPPSTAP
jgi:hypothetical protein